MSSPIDPAQHVLDVLTRLAERGVWSGSQSVLAVECGISVRTLARRLESLKADRSVQIERVAGKPCIYRVGAAIEACAVVPSGGTVEEVSSRDQLAVGLVGISASANTQKVDSASGRPSEHRKPATRNRITTRIVAIVGGLIAAVIGARTAKARRGRGPDPRQMTFDFEGEYHPNLPSHSEKQAVADSRCVDRNASPSADGQSAVCAYMGVKTLDVGRDLRPDRSSGRTSSLRDDQVAVNQSSRADAALFASSQVKAVAKPLVSIATDAQTAGARRADQLRASGSRQLSPPDSIDLPWRSFKLPFGTDATKLRDPRFIEEKVFEPAFKLGIVTEDERKHVVALVGYVLRSEPKTPAKLLTYILRGGKRLCPWRADLTEADWEFASNLVRRTVPVELAKRTGDLLREELDRRNEDRKAELIRKYLSGAK